MSRQNRAQALPNPRAASHAAVVDAAGSRRLGPNDPEAVREGLARVLADAYGKGLLSNQTLARRVDTLVGAAVVDAASLVEDLAIRVPRRGWRARLGGASAISPPAKRCVGDARLSGVLAVRWGGHDTDLLVGRDPRCDVVLRDVTVSRRHARLICRDGSWIVQDLDSMNGTAVNGVPVGRCELRRGDRLSIGDTVLWLE